MFAWTHANTIAWRHTWNANTEHELLLYSTTTGERVKWTARVPYVPPHIYVHATNYFINIAVYSFFSLKRDEITKKHVSCNHGEGVHVELFPNEHTAICIPCHLNIALVCNNDFQINNLYVQPDINTRSYRLKCD